jgi:hypothetical protein
VGPTYHCFSFFLLHSSFVHPMPAISSSALAGLVPRERLPHLELKQIADVYNRSRPLWRWCADSVSVINAEEQENCSATVPVATAALSYRLPRAAASTTSVPPPSRRWLSSSSPSHTRGSGRGRALPPVPTRRPGIATLHVLAVTT